MNPLDTKESLDRLRRIETRMWKICEHLGVEPPPGGTAVTLLSGPPGTPELQVPGFDTPLSTIKRELLRAGVSLQQPILVSCNGQKIAEVTFYG